MDDKLEFGLDSEGNIILGDEFSPDGCRLWDKETRKKMDKDRFRQGLGSVVETYIEVADRLGLTLERHLFLESTCGCFFCVRCLPHRSNRISSTIVIARLSWEGEQNKRSDSCLYLRCCSPA